MAESKTEVERALTGLGWEVRGEDERSDAVMAGYGKYHVMVSFEAGEPTSVIVSYVGKGGSILSSKWSGAEHLPTPRSVVRVLSQDA
jgi:hypothetical protein